MTDKTCTELVGTIKYILIKIDKFLFPIDFMVTNIKVEPKILIILGRLFIKTTRIVVYLDIGQVKFRIKIMMYVLR